MRVLLTSPPQPTHSILPEKIKPFHRILRWIGGNKTILGLQPPYGLLYLSVYLKRKNHTVVVKDGLISSTESIVNEIKKNQIDIVGISSVTWNWQEAKQLTYLLKDLFPSIKIAIGGAHVNSEQKNVLKECSCFDYAFYGDAEESFCKLVTDLTSKKKPEVMDGFAFRNGDAIIGSEVNSVINDLNGMLFPDRDSLSFDNYRPSPLFYRKLPFTAIFGSRGCPYKCTFCHTDPHVRMRSPENIVEEVVLLQNKYGIKEVTFYDDTFTLRKDRIFKLCDLFLKKGIKLSWSASVRVDTVDKEMLTQMKKAGCWRLLLGIESGSQRLLDRLKKRITIDQTRYAVDLIRNSGIQTSGMFMFGIPTETYEEGLKTIKFMKDIKLDYINVCNLTPFPGTNIYKEVVNESGFKGFERMNMFDIAYLPTSMNESQLTKLIRKSTREFYLRPSYIFRQIMNIRSFGDILRYIRGMLIVFLK
jgi:radical SAM superfamily enzyme YgiQ (UPF0313 family)